MYMLLYCGLQESNTYFVSKLTRKLYEFHSMHLFLFQNDNSYLSECLKLKQQYATLGNEASGCIRLKINPSRASNTNSV